MVENSKMLSCCFLIIKSFFYYFWQVTFNLWNSTYRCWWRGPLHRTCLFSVLLTFVCINRCTLDTCSLALLCIYRNVHEKGFLVNVNIFLKFSLLQKPLCGCFVSNFEFPLLNRLFLNQYKIIVCIFISFVLEFRSMQFIGSIRSFLFGSSFLHR